MDDQAKKDVDVVPTPSSSVMSTGRKVWLTTAVVISSLILLLCVVSIGGTWVARAVAINAADGLFATVDRLADVGRETGGRIDTRLATLESTTNRVGSTITQVGEEVSNRGVLLPLLPSSVEQELESAAQRIRELTETVRGVITAVTDLIDAVNRLPFVSIPTSDLEQINSLQTQLTSLREDVDLLVTRIRDFRAGRAAEINAAATLVGEIETEIITSRQRLAEFDEGLVRLKVQTAVWAQQFRTIATITAVGLTLLLGWVSYTLVWFIRAHWAELRQ